jgi:DNA-binding CsgD family transcriptional regulator/tetratricopeptide (TPR) repeat protein
LSPVSSQTIVGRAEPLVLLDELLTSAEAGHPRLMLLAGEAGVGKTRLASELEARARERGFVVLHGEAVEFGGEEFPYAPLVAALRDLPGAWLADALDDLDEGPREELAALLPRIRIKRSGQYRSSGRLGQGRLCELVLDLLGRLGGEHAPVLAVFEDVHWADRSTRDFLAFLGRNVRGERLAFALTYRTGELPSGDPLRRLLLEMTRRPVVTRLDLAPLTLPEVAQQLEAIAGHPVSTAVAEGLHARSGGNPFFVEELFAAERLEGGGRVPETVTEAVAARCDRLSPPARRLLVMLAAAGGRARHAVLEAARVDSDPGPPLREAVDAGLVLADDREVSLRHGLMGEVLYGGLVRGERIELHRALARALATTGAPAALLAHQWHRAGAIDAALAASVAAGLDAVRLYAFSEAAGHFARALDLWDSADTRPPGIDHVELLSHLAQAARFTGEREEAVTFARRALAEVDEAAEPLRAARIYERLGEFASWDDRAALDSYEQALRLLPPEPTPERARLLAAEGHALMGMRRWEEARDRCQAALAAVAEVGDDVQAAAAGVTLGLVLAFLGDADAGEIHLRRALDLSQRIGAGEQTARGYVHLGELLRLRGDHSGALEAMLTGERTAARLGMRESFGHFMFVNAADDLLRLGRWDEAHEQLEHAERMELGTTAAAMHCAIAGNLHALRGEPSLSRRHLERGLQIADAGLPSEFVTPLHSACAVAALMEGDPERARRHVDAAFRAAGDDKDPLYTPTLHSLGVRAEADGAERARARRRSDDVDAACARADRLIDDLERLLARHADVPDALAHREAARAERSRVRGRPDEQLWAAAARAWDELAEPYPAAYARLRLAEAVLGSGGDRRGAATMLAAAGATALALGARPLSDDVEALARRARLPPVAPQPKVPTPADEFALTGREVEVLALVAAGLTNRQIAVRLFISEKTVGTHVAHIFQKLDVHTRVEAAGTARALGLVTGALP